MPKRTLDDKYEDMLDRIAAYSSNDDEIVDLREICDTLWGQLDQKEKREALKAFKHLIKKGL